MNTMFCSVSGIQNTETKTQIKNALGKIKGIQKVDVDMAQSTIEIGYNDSANENDIKNSIENTGVKGVKIWLRRE